MFPATSQDPPDPRAHLEEMGQSLDLWTWATTCQSTCRPATSCVISRLALLDHRGRLVASL